MGKATIVEAIGAGLYKARPLWDFTRINLELLALQAQREKYWATLNQVLDAKRSINADVEIALEAMNAVIDQWKQSLIDKMNATQPIPPPTENDPQTALPWVDPDRAQDDPLRDAINAVRAGGAGPVTINATLSRAALAYAKYQGYTGRTGHTDSAGRGPEFRVSILGYGYTAVGELLAYGATTVAEAVATWMRDTEAKATLLGGFAEFGVAYCHVASHFGGHIWVVLLATPGPPPGTVTNPKPDPVTEKATETEAKLEKITVPKLDNLSPEQLGKAAQNYGIAIAKLREAERQIERLKAENLARETRITLLESIKNTPATMDVWCVDYDESLAVGATVDSMEVPGFWKEPGNARTSVLYKDTSSEKTVSWIERSWNLPPTGQLGQTTGILTPADALTDAAAFVNIALEPGHLKWMPRWRYAVITAKSGVTATISISAESARPASNESPLYLDRATSYTNVPFRYPCGSDVFAVYDEVFALFEGANRDQPVIIGFRREPEKCSGGRTSWQQL